MGRGAKPLSQLVKVKPSGRAPVSVRSSEVGPADRTAGWNSSCGFDHANTLSFANTNQHTEEVDPAKAFALCFQKHSRNVVFPHHCELIRMN